MRSRRHKLQVSTFPFLAVLLCAMGALLLVLLVMDRRAHDAVRQRAAQAARRAAEEAAQQTEEAAQQAETRRMAIEQARQEALAARRQERDAEHERLESQETTVQGEILSLQEQMTQAAERLRAEQDDEASLKQKIEAEHGRAESEEQALVRVQAEEKTTEVQSEAARQSLTQMTADLAQLERALADLKAAHEKEKQTYSVIPYNGKHGENRRPLYIECAAGEVIFHPDRTPLSEARLTAEAPAEIERRVARQKELSPPAASAAFTPFLMLLVRPDGVLSYYRLREALHGLKVEFGYEFVDKDWVLDFPADDRESPSQPWMSEAKSSPAAAPSTTPASELHHLIGVVPGREKEESSSTGPNGGGPIGPNGGGGPPRPPGLMPALSPSGIENNSGSSGVASVTPGGVAGGSLTPKSDGPPLLGPGDANPGPQAAGPPGPPRLFAPGGGAPGAAAATNGAAAAVGSHDQPGAVIAHSSADGTPPPFPRVGPDGASAAQQTATGASAPSGKTSGTPPPAPGVGPDGATATQPLATAASAPGGKSGALAAATGGAGTPGGSSKPASDSGSQGTAGSSATPDSKPPPETGTATGTQNATKTGQAAPPGARSGQATGGQTAAAEGPNDDPFMRSPPTPPLPASPKTKRPPLALRPARLSGDRDWIIYVECKEEGVVVYPTELLVPVSALGRPSGSNPLLQSVQQLIDRKQATLRVGETPYRPEVRFLVHPEAGRTYHLAYPTLDALAAPKTAQNLEPDDDVSAIVAH